MAYTVAQGTHLDAEGNVVWDSPSSGSSGASNFDWGGTLTGAGNFIGNLLGGVGSILHPTGQPVNPTTGQPYPTNTGGQQTPPPTTQPISTTTIVIGVVLLILIIVVIAILLKTKTAKA